MINKNNTKLVNKFCLILVLLGVGAATFVAGQTLNIPDIKLSADPLYAASGGDKPAMALALSVEFPTVGAQYVSSPGTTTDATYTNTKEYLGYYDAESCYDYNQAPTDFPAGASLSDYKRFDRIGSAIAVIPPDPAQPFKTSRMCNNAFSGNFLNWSSSSAIDMLRLALSGGDRYIDTAALTVLQRAVLPNGDPICMWNSGNFPAKQLARNGGGTAAYFGAVPNSMKTNAGTGDIWVSNTLNRIYFRNSRAGSCTDTISNNLGTPVLSRISGPGVITTGFPLTSSCLNGSMCGTAGRNEIMFGSTLDPNTWVRFVTIGPVTCSSANFPGGSTNANAACYVRPYTSTTPASPVATTTESSDAFFYARVRVCESEINAAQQTVLLDNRDYKLCTRYPSGNYKPTGSIQKYSDQLRLSAFGYAMDQTASYNNGRYGGVLRAPMKFVGAKTFDISGQDNTPTTGNPNAEWNALNGVFNANPDNDSTQTTPISGVINYLNKFGRTGPVLGRYKKFDPIGELHYETLRYLQGLQPSAAAVSSLGLPTGDLYDGFPITSLWTDPYGGGRSSVADYSCLKSNIVVIGDANTHDGNRLPTTNLADNIPNINGWRTTVQNFEKGVASSYLDGQRTTRQTSNPNTVNANPANNAQTSQIMGSAYWSRTHDIRGTDWTNSPLLQRPGLRTKTFIFDVNENGSSNDQTYRQNRNQLFTAAKYGGFETDASNFGANPFNTYGNPFLKQDGTVDNNVWQDATRPGEANTYYLQSDARGVLAAFESIFSRSANSARSIAGTSVGNSSLITGGSLVYQASFDTTDWNGDVLASAITLTNGTAGIATEPTWAASTRLGLLPSPSTSRNIVVGRKVLVASSVATPFTWAGIEDGLKSDLAKLTPTAVPDTSGQDRLNYLRGDKSKEGTQFRTRSKLLGDIVNSGVVYSGPPVPPVGSTAGFAAFRAANANRVPVVFVGANDGMLHAFHALTGDEIFAYIPSLMGEKLAALTSPTYNSNHQSYVDATPVVGPAKVGSGDTASDWKTVLVSGMGGGAAGVFALDVTNPATFSDSKVLWEFKRSDDFDMGFVVGAPKILKLRTSLPTATVATYRTFAAIASGVNNYVANSGFLKSGITGQPALFLLALDKAPNASWILGTNYYKITLPVDSALALTTPPGLINFTETIGLRGETEKLYMGDLHGKLWKLDFTKANVTGPSDWNIDKLSGFNKGTASIPSPYPLFNAATSAGVVQPITVAPLVLAGPVASGLKTNIVAFGTGKYLESGDKTSNAQQSFYAVFDDGSSTADNSPVGPSAISSRRRLQQGVINTTAKSVVVPAFIFGRATTDTAVGTVPVRSGWYFDFPASGERMVIGGTVNSRLVSVSSLIPASPGAVGSCTAAGGGGNSYTFNIDSGNGSYRVSDVGLLGQTLTVKISEVDQLSDGTGRGIKKTVTQNIRVGSQGSVADPEKTETLDVNRRLSWRMINNYLDLKRGK